MVTGKTALVGALIAIAVAGAVLALRSGSSTREPGGSAARAPDPGAREPASNGPVATRGPGAPPSHAPVILMPDASEAPVPAIPPPPVEDAAPAPSLDQTFVAEERDRAWAPDHENQMRTRLGALASGGVAVSAPECRTAQCRITLTAADDAAIGRYVAQLEEPGGFAGWAEMIVLEGVTATADGRRQTRVYAHFGRPDLGAREPK